MGLRWKDSIGRGGRVAFERLRIGDVFRLTTDLSVEDAELPAGELGRVLAVSTAHGRVRALIGGVERRGEAMRFAPLELTFDELTLTRDATVLFHPDDPRLAGLGDNVLNAV